MTEDKFLEEMRVFITRKYKRAYKAAEAWDCSASFVTQVLSGQKNPNPVMLEDMGYQRSVTVDYKRVKK